MNFKAQQPDHVFAALVLTTFLVLTALGNAIALLIFSVIALALWLAVPPLRGKVPFSRGLVTGVGSFVIAIAVAYWLNRSH